MAINSTRISSISSGFSRSEIISLLGASSNNVYRNFILDKRGSKCQNPKCKTPIVNQSKLHCHHLTYKRFGCEEENDLQILCESCHTKTHKEYTIQEIQEKFEISNYWNGIKIK